MISSQCDELRDTAMRVEIFLEGSTDAIPMDTHEQLRHAANTIWELRCKLAGTVDQREEVERLKAENEKLRELCADMLTCINAYKARKLICWECEHHRDVDELRSACFLGSDARKLGIEVE